MKLSRNLDEMVGLHTLLLGEWDPAEFHQSSPVVDSYTSERCCLLIVFRVRLSRDFGLFCDSILLLSDLNFAFSFSGYALKQMFSSAQIRDLLQPGKLLVHDKNSRLGGASL